MTPHETAQYMLNQDAFSQWMGIKLIEIREKYCLIEMPVKAEMIVSVRPSTSCLSLIEFLALSQRKEYDKARRGTAFG